MVNLHKLLLRRVDKRGFFYIFDAIIAFVVLVVGVIIILSGNVTTQNPAQTSQSAADFLNTLGTLQVGQVSYQTVLDLRRDGTLDHRFNTKTLMQAVYELHVSEYDTAAFRIVNETIGQYVLGIYNINFTINDMLIFNKSGTDFFTIDDAEFVVVQRQILLGQWDNQSLLGPYVAEIKIW